MDANEYQIGGDHYRSEYQHWDWVYDTGQPYHIGCATKYISRWRKKNGIQDLRKAIHYLNKAVELNLQYSISWDKKSNSYCDQLNLMDAITVKLICLGELDEAIKIIENDIIEIECGPSSNYIDPDSNYIKG